MMKQEKTSKTGNYDLKIIHAGFHRSGSASTSKALEILGLKTWHVETNSVRENLSAMRYWVSNNLDDRIRNKECMAEQFDHWLNMIGCDVLMRINCNITEFSADPLAKEKVLQAYVSTIQLAKEAFKDNPQNLLIYSVIDGWEPLCQFLNKEVPKVSFPRGNGRESLLSRVFWSFFAEISKNQAWKFVVLTIIAPVCYKMFI